MVELVAGNEAQVAHGSYLAVGFILRVFKTPDVDHKARASQRDLQTRRDAASHLTMVSRILYAVVLSFTSVAAFVHTPPGPQRSALAAEKTFVESAQTSIAIFQQSQKDGADFKQAVADALAGEYDKAAVRSKLEELSKSAPCVVFTCRCGVLELRRRRTVRIRRLSCTQVGRVALLEEGAEVPGRRRRHVHERAPRRPLVRGEPAARRAREAGRPHVRPERVYRGRVRRWLRRRHLGRYTGNFGFGVPGQAPPQAGGGRRAPVGAS